ncbi:MAG: hypothetical protein LUE29_09870 [Lachnospiraceae bacterium]|nr:hypothetical protein [Lachnospiraceae bacterium]
MYHSITFGDKNTWDDWHIVPTSRPFFSPPELKKKTLDIPGADGVIDLTEALTGYPVYENRTGSIEFVVMNDYCQPIDSADEWQEIYSDIMDYLHGQKMIAVLEDDPTYYYEGRFTVSQWQSGSYYSVITIDYDVNPYKWSLYDSFGEWLADPFDISSTVSVDASFKELSIDTPDVGKIFDITELIGRAPIAPTFTVSTSSGSGMVVSVYDYTQHENIYSEITIPDGTNQLSDFVFVNLSGDSLWFNYQCASTTDTGTMSVYFRKGRL